jgi:hypothetical protein
MYAERKPPGTPPCESCRVELREENEEAARIFNTVRGQIITIIKFTEHGAPYSVPVDLNHLAVWAAIDAYEVKDRTGTFERVMKLFYFFQRQGNAR